MNNKELLDAIEAEFPQVNYGDAIKDHWRILRASVLLRAPVLDQQTDSHFAAVLHDTIETWLYDQQIREFVSDKSIVDLIQHFNTIIQLKSIL